MEELLLNLCVNALKDANIKFEYNCQTIWIDDGKDTYSITCTKCEPDEHENG